MSYKVTSTEKNNQKSADFETRSLLYLLNYHVDHNEIHFFVIDFFNDVSGIDRLSNKIWDIQSKGKFVASTLLGNCLVTLFKNYLSEFSDKFVNYILYVESISPRILIDNSLTSFDNNNIKEAEKIIVRQGLIDEAKSKTYVSDFGLTQVELEDKVDEFLDKVSYVVDTKTKAELIKNAINVDATIYPSDSYLENIFKEIRSTQASKKLISTEGQIINSVSDFSRYNKYIKAGQIVLLITSRLINMDLSKDKRIPHSFSSYLSALDEREKADFIEDCLDGIYRMIFDNNNVLNYWKFFENAWKTVKNNHSSDVETIYEKLSPSVLDSIRMDMNSIKYFVALIKDGMKI